jgi:hypothetical protein
MQLLGVHEIATMSVAHEKGVTCEHYTCMFMHVWITLRIWEQCTKTHARDVMCIHVLAGKKHKNILLQPITGVVQPDSE